jgi:FtsX-like permease family
VERVTSLRGPLAVRRMTAHAVVLAAAALTTLVAATVGAAFAAFAGQALPQAVRHDLVVAPGTTLSAAGSFAGGDPAQTSAALRSSIAAALGGVSFSFWPGTWSDPLGFLAGSLPAKPASITSGNIPQLQAASLDGVTDHAVLVTGKWPGQFPASAAGPIPAAMPASTAALLKLRPGDVLRVRDQDTGAPVTFILTGLFAERQSHASASYWQLSSIPASGSVNGTGPNSGYTTYGPLVVSPSMFPGRLAEGTGTWVAQPDMAGFNAAGLFAISFAGDSSLLSGLTLTTNLPAVLADTGDNLAVARSLLGIGAVELLVLTVAALLVVARLLAAQREGQTALLTARGATRWQLTTLTAAEVVPLSLVTALTGGVAGIWLARLLGSTLYGPGTAGRVPDGGISVAATGTWLDALAAALGIAVLSIGALLHPVLRPAQTAARVQEGRRAVLSRATRAGADVALVALAVLACWQLRRYSAVSTSAGSPSVIDPVLLLAPALALAAGTVLTLRLLPTAARAVDRVATAGRRLTSALAGWQFSRQPLRQGGPALLLVMAVGTGTLALAQHQSWTRSAADQAAYVTGADAQVNLASPEPAGATTSITGAAGVRAAMAVSAVQAATPAQVVAIDAAQAPKVALLRADQSNLPPAALLRSIAPSSPSGGLLISGRPQSVRFTVTLSRAPLGPVTAQFTVTDATGAAFALSPALFSADGRPHVLTASLGGTGAAYPLRLSQVTLFYVLPAKPLKTPVTLTVAGATPRTWTAAASSPELVSELSTDNMYGPSAGPRVTGWQRAPRGATLTFTPGYGRWSPAPGASPVVTEPVAGQVSLSAPGTMPAVVPAIATRAFDSANNTGVGSIVQTTVNRTTVPAKIVAVAGAFPTITGAGLVMDLSTLEAFLVSHGAAPVAVTQWWLATAGGRVPAALTRALPPGATVASRAALAAATVADPLSAAPQQALLAMTVAAALLAIFGFWVSIAADVRQRRAENAVLAALGVSQRCAAAQLFLEKLLLSVPAAAFGLLLGTVVARLLVPAVTLSPTAQTPVPPPLTMFDLPQTIPLAAAAAVLPALAAALVVLRHPDPAAELRAAEAA